jgi:PAS domain S-box-containing protein
MSIEGLDLPAEQRALLDALLHHAPVAIAIFRGPSFVVEIANPLALRIWGQSDLRAVVGKPLFEIASDLAGQGFEELLIAVREEGKQVVGREFPLRVLNVRTGQRELRYFDFTYGPLRGESGPSDRIFTIGTDVTESVQLRLELTQEADIALRASRERAQRVADAALIGTWEIDLATMHVQADQKMLKLLGVRPEDPRHMHSYVDRIADEDRPRIAQAIEDALAGKDDGLIQADCRWQRSSDGGALWIEGRGKVDFDAAGRPIKFVGTVADITARKEAELERERLLVTLQSADQRKDEFLATLAHELRNPMAAISTALMLLESSGGDAEKAARYHATAKRQMGNLVRMVDDLLDVARVTRGTIELRKEEVDLVAIVQHALASARSALDARNHALTVTTASGELRMHGDATRLEQVVTNLLTNAARYTDPGGHITVQLGREQNGDGSLATLRVCDTGRGIPVAMLAKVFEPFTQVSPSIDRSTGGLGLGLTLVRRLVEMHGGTVEALSDGLDRGSTFTVRLPLLQEVAKHVEPATTAAPTKPALAARRVLLIDDSEDLLEMLRELLESYGHDVLTAVDGLEGVTCAAEQHPDIALIDIGLPGIDGFEVARRVRGSANGRAPYLIALSGYGSPEVKAKAEQAGFDMHMTKPVDLAALLELVAQAGRA